MRALSVSFNLVPRAKQKIRCVVDVLIIAMVSQQRARNMAADLVDNEGYVNNNSGGDRSTEKEGGSPHRGMV